MRAYFSKHQQELERLEQKFKKLEQDALTVATAPLGSKHLCFRLDGIKVSKRFLKNDLVNEEFSQALRRAIQSVYILFRRCTGVEHGAREAGNFFLCAFCISDEVSFILNNQRNHLDNRLFKTGTALAGTLSGALSLNFATESKKTAEPNSHGKRYPQVVAFDARPLLLDVHGEVEEYIRYRWLLAGRNTMGKVIRLAGKMSGDETYNLGRANDLAPLYELIEQHGLGEQYHRAMRAFTMFVPTALTHEALFQENHPSNGTDGIVELCERVRRLQELNG